MQLLKKIKIVTVVIPSKIVRYGDSEILVLVNSLERLSKDVVMEGTWVALLRYTERMAHFLTLKCINQVEDQSARASRSL